MMMYNCFKFGLLHFGRQFLEYSLKSTVSHRHLFVLEKPYTYVRILRKL